MTRIEVILDATIAEEFSRRVDQLPGGLHYSMLESVKGRGTKGPRRGDSVWPEENYLYILYVDDDDEELTYQAIRQLRDDFPRSAVAAFSIPGAHWH